MAPEVLDCLPHDPYAADMWSLGNIFYTILVGRSPYQNCTLGIPPIDVGCPVR